MFTTVVNDAFIGNQGTTIFSYNFAVSSIYSFILLTEGEFRNLAYITNDHLFFYLAVNKLITNKTQNISYLTGVYLTEEMVVFMKT